MEKTLIIHTDGGARGNPGPAACAFVAEIDNKEIHKESKFLGSQTNNFAEYQGVILATQWIAKKSQISNRQHHFVGKSQIIINSDSELIVRQLNGVYKMKSPNLKKLNEEIKKIISKNNLKVTFKNVPRVHNKIADALVNEELDRV
jgi:ribonuclease HI